MSKWLALSAGAITSAALLYRFQYDIEHSTNQILKSLHHNQNKLEASLPSNLRDGTPKRPLTKLNDEKQLPLPSITKAEQYISHRFIPTFKSAWNEHITEIAHHLTNFDIDEATKSGYIKAKSLIEENLVKKK
ncbi:hypothetical protein C1645_769551 [Glomus cerebriforme]|uniref:MICOS complex subunit MIC12 n=1 Tax=Glomus cerebriforme TaxID=658196 RepID=A0A397SZY3_9GLOM|nr:hypothetical protein C1645_769551 [Glomus cerebriforme]